jgi:hypothetical protein
MAIRVVHWGVGQTGKLGLQGVIGHPELDLVGLGVARPENEGRDAGDLCDRPRTGIVATSRIDDLLALKPDCFAYFGAGAVDLEAGLSIVERFLEARVNVVTTSLSPLIFPHALDPALRERVEGACRRGGSTVFATGIEPGFASDLLPYNLMTIVDELDVLHIQEIADYSHYAVEYVQRQVFGFGQPMGFQPILFQGERLKQTWKGVVTGMANDLGITLDDVTQETEQAASHIDLSTAFGEVKAGTVGAVRFALKGIAKGRAVIVMEHINYLHEAIAPEWGRGGAGKGTVYRTMITGRPNLVCELVLNSEGGRIATAMRAINAIPIVVEAREGLLEPLQVPARPSGHVRGLGRGMRVG